MYQSSPSMPLEMISSMEGYSKGYKEENNTSQMASTLRWLQLKKYQFEVTIPLYMLTPRERKIFYLVVFVLITMAITAALFYLPNHITIIYNRVLYYVEGSTVSTTIVEAVRTTKAALAHRTASAAIQQTTQRIVNEL